MTEKEFQAQNMFISKWMEYEPYEDGRYGTMWPDPTKKGNMVVKHMRYHESWDWLMPVVEAIIDSKYSDGANAYLRTFGNKMCRFNRMGLHEGVDLLEATYNAVFEWVTSALVNNVKKA